MNNRRLRALIVRLQDRLTEDDRKRLHFFLGNDVPRRVRDDPSLGGTLSLMESLFDQDKINEKDFTFLINAFDEIQCLDAVKLLREYKAQLQSNGLNESIQSLSLLMPPLLNELVKDQEEDKFAVQIPLINGETFSNNNNVIINSHNSTINSEIIKNSNQTKTLLSEKPKRFLNKFFILSILLLIIQGIMIFVGCIWIIELKRQNSHILHKHTRNNTITHSYLKDLLLKHNHTLNHLKNLLSIDDEKLKILNKTVMDNNAAIKKLTERLNFPEDEQRFKEGKTCGCAQWCFDHGSLFGVCGTGHTCICRQHPITKNDIGDNCRCESWCKRRNYTGGICGDGYTCICTE